jgi:hypothetical protein
VSSSPTTPSAAPFTLVAAQNGSVPTPFGLLHTPSPPRCCKLHRLLLFHTMVNSANAGVHHRSTGSGDPLVLLSLPRGVPVHCEAHGPFLLHTRRPKPPHRVLLSTTPTGSPRAAIVRPPPPHLLRLQATAGLGEAHRHIGRAPRCLLRCSPPTSAITEPNDASSTLTCR